MIHTDLHNFLTSNSAIAAVTSTRIYHDHLPQGVAYPAIIWEQNSSDHVHDLSGVSGFCTTSFDITSCATTITAAGSLAETVREELDGYIGTWGATTIAGVLIENDWLDCDSKQDGNDTNYVYQVLQTYNISYRY